MGWNSPNGVEDCRYIPLQVHALSTELRRLATDPLVPKNSCFWKPFLGNVREDQIVIVRIFARRVSIIARGIATAPATSSGTVGTRRYTKTWRAARILVANSSSIWEVTAREAEDPRLPR